MSQSQYAGTADYFLSAAMGSVKDATFSVFSASNADVDTGTEDLIPQGGFYTWLAAATNVEVVSSSAADAAAGTGARTMRVVGLNYRRMPITEVVTLNGLTPVVLTQQYLRINNMMCLTAGSGAVNAGDIVARPQGGGATISEITPGYGRSQMGIFTVPADRMGFVVDTIFNLTSGTNNDQVSFQLLSRPHNGCFFSRAVVSATAMTPTIITSIRASGAFSPGDDMIVRCITQVASNVTVHATVSVLQLTTRSPLLLPV